MNLIVNNDYPFSPVNHPHLVSWLKELGGSFISPTSILINNETIDDYDWWNNWQCAITSGIVKQLIKEGK